MKENTFTVEAYHKILCPDYPDFLDEYIALPIMQRLAGVSLLCGTDWTPLFKNQFYYSRLDHSVGTALIVWNFTKDKKQTLAALFHDISTPAFSHVIDFKNGDRMNQTSTEMLTSSMINSDVELSELLFRDGIYKYEVDNYHIYPVADNEIPKLSADRLEYMYPSAAILKGLWTIDEVRDNYNSVVLLQNEYGKPELGFDCVEQASLYTKKFLEIGMLLQQNEDKVAMQLMADIINRAIKINYIEEKDLYEMDEASIIAFFEDKAASKSDEEFVRLFKTYRNMTNVICSDEKIDGCYCVSFDVKKRYINPLVDSDSRGGILRISDLDKEILVAQHDLLVYKDRPFGCVPYYCESL